MHYPRIVLFSVACAILYGIVHDQVTAHVCVEYFTVAHPSLLGIRDPTILGFAWGVVATWWVGLELGVPLALAARLGPRPKLVVRDLCRPILVLALVVGLTSALAGLLGYNLARAAELYLPYYYAGQVPKARIALFMADAWAHESAYTVGTVGGILVCVWTVYRRGYIRRGEVLARWTSTAWRVVGRAWDRSIRPGLIARLLTVVALAVFILGTYALCGSWFIAGGDIELAYFAVALGWPIVLLLFWAVGSAALLTARQPRAAALFLVGCLMMGIMMAIYLFGMASSTGVSVLEAFLVLDVALIYVAWRLLLRPSSL